MIRDAAKDSADRIIETCRSQLAVEPKNEAARGSHAAAWSAAIVAVGAAALAAALAIIYP